MDKKVIFCFVFLLKYTFKKCFIETGLIFLYPKMLRTLKYFLESIFFFNFNFGHIKGWNVG